MTMQFPINSFTNWF